ncbi:MAG TPA: DUF2891 domain-containing protein [Candidatus Acidoferrales bacterium]|nr:DUF2891 domain-containing protein [Candidatus Acidoferrales bacterium]
MKPSFGLLSLIMAPIIASAAEPQALDAAHADQFARLALAGIDREYPNKPGEVLARDQDLLPPRVTHPAFFGCFDWHSSVHGHWMLVRLLRTQPALASAGEIRARLAAHLTASNLVAEAAYFDPKDNRSFERMYGWAWALRLAAELRVWNDPDARQWARNFAPLERKLVALTEDYLPRLTYPIRTGVHPDTAFALAQILDYARVAGDTNLEQLVVERARTYYTNDRDYPVQYEPSGEDFFSPGLNVADLMRRVLPPDEFSRWLDGYLPGLRAGRLGAWQIAVEASDLTDPRIVHLVGLNLSRAWTMQGVASALAPDDPRRAVLEAAVRLHTDAGLKYVFSGHYEGEHWLATFAIYDITGVGLGPLR